MWVQRGRARSTTGHKARSGQSGCWPVPPAKHGGPGRPYILHAHSAAYCPAPGTAFLRDTWEQEQPTTKMHHSHSCYTYKKITTLCYSRRFACCKTIVINHRPISAAILKFALPGVVMFQPFFFFLLHFFFATYFPSHKYLFSLFNSSGISYLLLPALTSDTVNVHFCSAYILLFSFKICICHTHLTQLCLAGETEVM